MIRLWCLTSFHFTPPGAGLAETRMTSNMTKIARRDGLTRVVKDPKAEYVDEIRLSLEVADLDVASVGGGTTYYLANMLAYLKQLTSDLYVMHQPEYANPDGSEGWRYGRIYKCDSILELPQELAAYLRLGVSADDAKLPTEALFPLRTVTGAALPAKFIFPLHVEEDGSYPNFYETELVGANNDLRFFAYDGFAAADVSIAYVDDATHPPTVAVVGGDITVHVDSANTTAQNVMDAVNADADASKLVRVSLKTGNDGTGLVAVLAKAWVTTWSSQAIAAGYLNDRGY